MRHTRPLLLLTALSVLLATVACGNDDGAAASKPSTTTTKAPPAYPASIDPVPSAGCGTAAGASSALHRERRNLIIGGEERWFLLSVPASADGKTPVPLVMEFHGLAEGAAIAAEMSQIDALGESEGFVSVFPNGSGAPIRWNQHLDSNPNHDFELVTAILDTLEDELCVDEARVYATGLSYGAIMSSAIACVMADRFAAIAPVSGVEHAASCKPARPIPVLAFHGTADPILFFNGGVGDLGAALSGGTLKPPDRPVDLDGDGYPAAMRAWAEANGCGPSTDERRSPHVIERTFDCPADAEVRFLIIEGGGHSWPSSKLSESIAGVVGPTTHEIDATTEIWQFFTRHARAAI